jgi:hypothetical protein
MTDGISPLQFYEAEGVDDWLVLAEGAEACFRTGSFAASVRPSVAARARDESGGRSEALIADEVRPRHPKSNIRRDDKGARKVG